MDKEGERREELIHQLNPKVRQLIEDHLANLTLHDIEAFSKVRVSDLIQIYEDFASGAGNEKKMQSIASLKKKGMERMMKDSEEGNIRDPLDEEFDTTDSSNGEKEERRQKYLLGILENFMKDKVMISEIDIKKFASSYDFGQHSKNCYHWLQIGHHLEKNFLLEESIIARGMAIMNAHSDTEFNQAYHIFVTSFDTLPHLFESQTISKITERIISKDITKYFGYLFLGYYNQKIISKYNESLDSLCQVVSSTKNANLKTAALGMLSRLYDITSEEDKAMEICETAINLRSNFFFPYVVKGTICQKRNEISNAIEMYSKAISLYGQFHVPYYNLAILYHYVKEEYDSALKNYSETIKLKPKLCQAYLQRGSLLLEKMNRVDDAMADLNQAVELNPSHDHTAYYNRAIAHEKKQQYESAFKDYQKAIELNPKFSQAYNNCGLLIFEHLKDSIVEFVPQNEGNPTSWESIVLDYYNRAIGADPTFSRAYNNRANFYFFIGDDEKAELDYSMAIELDSTFLDAYYNRSNLNLKLKNYIHALTDLNHIVRFEQDFSQGEALKKRNMVMEIMNKEDVCSSDDEEEEHL